MIEHLHAATFQTIFVSLTAMNVAVFLKEGQHRLLVLEKGKLTTAEEMKIMMLELLSIPKNAAHLFAIWFISPHLG